MHHRTILNIHPVTEYLVTLRIYGEIVLYKTVNRRNRQYVWLEEAAQSCCHYYVNKSWACFLFLVLGGIQVRRIKQSATRHLILSVKHNITVFLNLLLFTARRVNMLHITLDTEQRPKIYN
jgi:hypothetical protein